MKATFLLLIGSLCALVACAREPQPAPEVSRSSVVEPRRQVAWLGEAPVYRKDLLFEVFHIDRIYRSMQGPTAQHEMTLAETAEPSELLWIIGYRAVLTEPDGTTPMSREFMCHSNVSLLQRGRFLRSLPTELLPHNRRPRLFSLAQGQLSVELPSGFGVPILSDQPLGLDAQVLNHNITDRTFDVRQRLSIEFVRDSDLEHPLKPLVPRGVFGMKLVEGADGYPGFSAAEAATGEHGPGCLAGIDADGGRTHAVDDDFGRKLTGFWVLPPGREVNRTPVTKLLDVPYDTTVHYIAAHVHPFAESVGLRDLTTGELVWRSRARPTAGRIGLDEVEYFSSEEGLPLYKDHAYELESVYDNTSGVNQDAMATLFLYLQDKDLREADLRPAGGWPAAGSGGADAG